MDRSTMLAILNAASDDSLKSALETIGVSMGDHDDYGEGLPGQSENPLPTWDNLDVTVPAAQKKPMWDKSSMFLEKQVQPQRDQLGLQQAGDQEMMMTASGLV